MEGVVRSRDGASQIVPFLSHRSNQVGWNMVTMRLVAGAARTRRITPPVANQKGKRT